MKKNAILIAGIMAVSGAATAQAGLGPECDHEAQGSSASIQQESHDSLKYSTEGDSDVSADSSLRGGSPAARGYDREADANEVEDMPDPINPGVQADSSIRGGSIYSREQNWQGETEPPSSEDHDHHLKADSSIRGGSLEARGGREASGDFPDYQSSYQDQGSDVILGDEDQDFHFGLEADRDDFGQGSSSTFQSDKGGSLRGSANWNQSDDLLRDGVDVEADSSSEFELNSDASVGGAVKGETGSASSSDWDSDMDKSGSLKLNSDLNSSQNLEENISGDFDLESQDTDKPASQSSLDSDKPFDDSTTDSVTSTDILHDEYDLSGSANIESEFDHSEIDMEAAGAAATSESGTSSSSDVSNDPALQSSGSPLDTTGNEPNWLYKDNPAQGVGSLATGDFGSAASERGLTPMTDSELERLVRQRLVNESTGTHGLMRHQVARNIEVIAQDGTITLTGSVPAEKDKKMVEIRVREISQVRGVDNQLKVNPQSDPGYRDLSIGHDLEETTSRLQD